MCMKFCDLYQSLSAIMKVFPIKFEKLFSRMVIIMFYGFKIIGLAPISLQTKTQTRNSRNNSVRVFLFSKIGLIYNFIISIILMIMGVIAIQKVTLTYYDVSASVFTRMFDLTEKVSCTSTGCFIIVYLGMAQKKTTIIMNKLLNVHLLLHCGKEDRSLSHKKTCILPSIYIIIHAFVWIGASVTTEEYDTFLDFLISNTCVCLISFIFIEYSIILKAICIEFDSLNKNLSILNDVPNYSNHPWSFQNHRTISISSLPATIHHNQLLKTIRLLHSIRTNIFSVSQYVNELFSFPILLCVACNFLQLIYCAYFVIVPLLVVSSDKVGSKFDMNIVYWSLIVVYPVILLLYNATETSEKAKLTGPIIHKLLASAKQQEITAELEQFSLQLIHEDVNFTAFGFFALDFTLLQSMIGATATYLVIIIQFLQSRTEAHN